ncbi:MAG TPA: N-acetylmuramoyl-L-alanine amidase [Caldisericia bacterium]|nr:N-acetylmuramoyl-L-alanine amidase [Caldisericia bacterium]
MKKFLLRVISILCIVIISFPVICSFQYNIVECETLKYAVITPKVNIRNAPSLSADVVFVIEEKGEFLITREMNDVEGKLWYKIKLRENLEGFVASWVIDRVKTVQTETEVKGKFAIIESGVRIRREPSTDSEIKLVVKERVEKEIYAEIKDSQNQLWYKIKLNDGSFGWVASWVVEIKVSVEDKKSASTKLIIVDPPVNLRKGPGLKHEIVATITSHLETRGIYEAKDEFEKIWYMIKLPNSVEGWIASWVATVKEYSEEKTPVSDKVAIIDPIVNIRDAPSIQSKIIAVIESRSEFPILNQGKDVNGKIWYEIKLSNSTGWVASWVIQVKSNKGEAETNDSVNVRKGPGTNFEKLFEMPANSEVTILGSAYISSGEYWLAIQSQGKKGWVLSSLISSIKKDNLVSIEKVGVTFSIPHNIIIEVFEGPDKSYKRKGTLDSKFGVITIVGVANNLQNELWYQIKGSKFDESWVDSLSIISFLEVKEYKQHKITSLSWAIKTKGITLSITFDEDDTYEFNNFILDNPLRFVIDIKNSILFQKDYSEEINKESITKVKASQFSVNPNIVRIVLDLEKNLSYVVTKEKGKLVIELTDYSEYSGPRLFIGGVEIENNLLLKNYNNVLYVPLYIFSNMTGGIISWEEKSKEAIFKLYNKEYRFKPDDMYVFIKGPEHESRLEINNPITIINDTLYISVSDCSKIFSLTYSNFNNLHYLDNNITGISVNKAKEGKILTLEYALPVKIELKENDNILNVINKNTILGNSIKIPDDEVLLKIISNKRNLNQQAESIIQLNISKFPRYESAFLYNNHQLIMTLKSGKSKGIDGKLIIVDAGHGAFSEDGYYDTGAIGPTGLLESVVNLKIAIKLKELLEKEGAKVILTREKEQDKSSPTLEKRIEDANKSGADLFISIHQNASVEQKAGGTEVYYYNDSSSPIAQFILDTLCSKIGLVSRGVKKRGFAVVQEITVMPSILVECAFISNPAEEKLLGSDSFINLIAEGLLAGIKKFFES